MNKNNNKVYVGQSIDIFKRWREHEKMLKRGNHHSYKLQQAYDGELDKIDAFDFEIILRCKLCELDDMEKRYMVEYDTLTDGYNVKSEGVKVEEELKVKKPKSDKLTVQEINRIKTTCDEKPLNTYDLDFKTEVDEEEIQIGRVLNTFVCLREGAITFCDKFKWMKDSGDFLYDIKYEHIMDSFVYKNMKDIILYCELGKDGYFKYFEYHYLYERAVSYKEDFDWKDLSNAFNTVIEKVPYKNKDYREFERKYFLDYVKAYECKWAYHPIEVSQDEFCDFINSKSVKMKDVLEILEVIGTIPFIDYKYNNPSDVLFAMKLVGLNYYSEEELYHMYPFLKDFKINKIKYFSNTKYDIWKDKEVV